MKIFWLVFIITFHLYGGEVSDHKAEFVKASELKIAPLILKASSFENFELNLLNSGVMCCDEDFASPEKSVLNNQPISLGVH